jgi:AcrR family transcriptional regulator
VCAACPAAKAPSGTTQAHPPGPGFPLQAPSVYTIVVRLTPPGPGTPRRLTIAVPSGRTAKFGPMGRDPDVGAGGGAEGGGAGDGSAPPQASDRPATHRASAEPVTERGRRTRAALIAAARNVFAERGYHDATIGDITTVADVAHGTFYTYFESKRELFKEVVEDLVDELRNEARSLPRSGTDPWSRIERANRGYLRAYARNAALMGVLEQVAIADSDLRDARQDSRRFWTQRAQRQIQRWQEEGMARPDVDAGFAANALAAMVDRCAFLWLVWGDPYDEDEAVANLTDLYATALGIDRPGRRDGGPLP